MHLGVVKVGLLRLAKIDRQSHSAHSEVHRTIVDIRSVFIFQHRFTLESRKIAKTGIFFI